MATYTPDTVNNFEWRYNLKSNAWDMVVYNPALPSHTSTHTAYQWNNATNTWNAPIELSYRPIDLFNSPQATPKHFEYYYAIEENIGSGEYTYSREDENSDSSNPGQLWLWNGNGWEKITYINPDPKISTYFIAHGMMNTYKEGWIDSMATDLAKKGQVITVDWGDWADNGWIVNPVPSANKVEDVAARAAQFLSQLLLSQGNNLESFTPNLNLIGHSHGSHVSGYLAQELKKISNYKIPKSLVALDASEELSHMFHGGVDWWLTDATEVYYFKSSTIYGSELLYLADYNFVVVDANAGLDGGLDLLSPGTSGHGYAYVWYEDFIESGEFLGKNKELSEDLRKFRGKDKWLGLFNNTLSMECVTIGYEDRNGNSYTEGNKWDFNHYYNTLQSVVGLAKFNSYFDSLKRALLSPTAALSEIARHATSLSSDIYAISYLADFTVGNSTILANEKIAIDEKFSVRFFIENNADNISFTDKFVRDNQANMNTTYQIWLSNKDEFDIKNSIRIYEDDLQLAPDRGNSNNKIFFTDSDSHNITVSLEQLQALGIQFNSEGEADAYLFARVGTEEGTNHFIPGELYTQDNTSNAEKVTFVRDSSKHFTFVIDDTGSMGEEIASVRSALLKFIAKLEKDVKDGKMTVPTMELITFKGYASQPFTTTSFAQMEEAINRLRASGSPGSAPGRPSETGHWAASDKGLKLAVDRIGNNGTIIFATDARAGTTYNIGLVLNKAKQKGVSVNTIISGKLKNAYIPARSSASLSSIQFQSDSLVSSDLTSDYGNSQKDSNLIYIDTQVSGLVNYSEDAYDWMKIKLDGQHTYSISFNTTDSTRAFFNLYAQDGTTLIESIETGEQFTFIPAETATYYIKVRAFLYSDTNYTFEVAETTGFSDIGSTMESFATLSQETGGVYLVYDDVNSGNQKTYESAVYNLLNSVIEPAVVSSTPYVIPDGSTIDISISGQNTNWREGISQVGFSSDKIETVSVTVISPTKIIARIRVADDCPPDIYDVTVSTGAEIAKGVDILTVKEASSTKQLISVIADTFAKGDAFIATLRGLNTEWTDKSTVNFGEQISVTSIEWISETELKVRGTISEEAIIGFRTVYVTTDGKSESLSGAVFVEEDSVDIPTISISNPSPLNIGRETTLTIEGHNIIFKEGNTIVSLGAHINVLDLKVIDKDTLTVTIYADREAVLGFRDIQVRTDDQVATLLNGLLVDPAVDVLSNLEVWTNGNVAKFSWDTIANSDNIVGYRLEYSKNSDYSDSQMVQVSGEEFIDFNLTANSDYYWRVSTIDKEGNIDWTDWQSFETGAASIDDDTPEKHQQLVINSAHHVKHSDQIGLGDATDYLGVAPHSTGIYSVKLDQASIQSSLKLSIGQMNDEGEFVATRSLMVGPHSAHTGFEGLHLEAGEEYLVRVDAFDMGAGCYNTNYELIVQGEIPEASTITDNNSFEKATELVLNNQGDASTRGWVGAGDARDIYAFELFDAGAVALSLSAMSAAAKLDVYQEMSNGSMRRVSSQVVYSSGLDTALNLSSGSYFLQVSSYDNGAGNYQSAYDLSINADDQKNKPGYIA